MAGNDPLRAGADRVVKAGLSGWWERRTDAQQTACAFVSLALAIGPLGQGFLGAVEALYSSAIPSSTQLEAVVWLAVITAPLFAFVFVLVALIGKAATPGVLIGAGVAAFAGSFIVSGVSAGDQLAGVYCFADFTDGRIVYEEVCRQFNDVGFRAETAPYVGNPSGAPSIFSSALAYTVDARGALMATSSMLAAIGLGALAREQVDSAA